MTTPATLQRSRHGSVSHGAQGVRFSAQVADLSLVGNRLRTSRSGGETDPQVSTPLWDMAMGARAALLVRQEGAPVTEERVLS